MYEPISNFTTTSTTSGITLSSIPGTYKHLMLVTNIKTNTGYADIAIQANGSTGGSSYSMAMFYGNGTGSKNPYRTTRASYQISNWSYADSTKFNTAISYFHNYSNTNLYKTLTYRSVRGMSDGGVDVGTSNWFATQAITSLYVYPTTNSFAAGCTFSLYGIV
jgi:hypothetical protein